MKYTLIGICLLCFFPNAFTQTKTIHVFVALCDNANQGIVPVPASLGNGQNPRSNLYWGAGYGIKTQFKRLPEWELIETKESSESPILEQLIFKHKTSDTYLLAEAYDGAFIKKTTQDFVQAASGKRIQKMCIDGNELSFGGGSNVLAYIGHDGLMEFHLDMEVQPANGKLREVIILACYSKDYFQPHIKKSGATPLLWTTGLMAPEAYTLAGALDAWINGKSYPDVRERAAYEYNKYQKCGMRGARNLFRSGW